MNALEVRNLTKTFGRFHALRGVSFSLPEGSVGGLVGPNGAGKTTLFSIIAGYQKPNAGDVRLFGRECSTRSSLNGVLGILPQDAQFLRQLPMGRHFVFYARLMGFRREEAETETRRVLEAVDLLDAIGMEGDRLSHGMRKRMAIAQALIGRPRLLLLDEPTAGLDPRMARSVRDLIRSLRGERSVLVSSHNLDEIVDVCDHVTILDRGRLVESRTISELTREIGVITFTLDAPVSEAALRAVEVLPAVATVVPSADEHRIACSLESSAGDGSRVIASVVAALAEHGLTFTDIKKGTTLEDRFLEMTDPSAAGSSS